MQDDLGIQRVEELPIEDEHPGDRGNRGHGHRNSYAVRPTRKRAPAPNGEVVDAVMSMWQSKNPGPGVCFGGLIIEFSVDAKDLGTFDDSDSEQVKGLSDLGGGRLYDKGRESTLKVLNKVAGRG